MKFKTLLLLLLLIIVLSFATSCKKADPNAKDYPVPCEVRTYHIGDIEFDWNKCTPQP